METMDHPDKLWIKRNELTSHVIMWRKLQCTFTLLQSERMQSEKATNRLIPIIGYSGKDTTLKTIERSVVGKSGV